MYRELYGLQNARKFLRGTLRYHGFTELINGFKEIGYFSEKPVEGDSWLEYTSILLEGEKGKTLEHRIKHRTVFKVKHFANCSNEENKHRAERILNGIKFFGLLSEQKVTVSQFSSLTRNSITSKIS